MTKFISFVFSEFIDKKKNNNKILEMEKKLAVIALGGNALLRGNQKGTIEEQNANTVDTLENLVYLIKDGYNLIISHGNGPQVGNVLMDNAAGAEMYGNAAMPLDTCVAFTQGQIGYMIERNLRNILKEHGLQRNVISMVSQVIVDKNDPAMQNPTKRVGKIYTKAEADKLAAEKGWIFKEEIKVEGGWRRVVPSPDPKDFMNADLVERLAREGNIVITTGGGGIPVYKPLPRFPAVTRDIAVVCGAEIPVGDMVDHIMAEGGQYLKGCRIFDVYTGHHIAEGKKSVAFSLTMRADDQTLTDDHAEETVKKVLAALERKFGASIR